MQTCRMANWSPCLRYEPSKDILHTTRRVIFLKCKSDDHFTPFLQPFSDFPWQRSKLLCRAQKALCGSVPESLQPHFWHLTVPLPQADHMGSFGYIELCHTVLFLCVSAHVFLMSTKWWHVFKDPIQLTTPLLWHYPNSASSKVHCSFLVMFPFPWILWSICPF